jgi:hypothetical protein
MFQKAIATRFAGWQPLPARLLIALLMALSAYGVAATLQPVPAREEAAVDLNRTDLALYTAIAQRVGEGESYYSAVVAEQRARNYPLRPVVTVRLPTLAWTIGTIGPERAALLLRLLMIGAIAALALRLRAISGSKPQWAAATFIAAASIVLLTVPAMTWWHESWSALLLVVSLSCRSRQRWAASVAFGLAAVLFRELALPYLCVMAVLALRERSRAEAAAWAAAILIFFAALALHAAALTAHVHSGDPASPGWASAGGWPFILSLVQRCTVFALLPLPLVAVAVPLALIGWASVRGETGNRGTFLLLLYIAAFMLVGRSDNFYWGLMIAPLLPLGLAFAPSALRDLARAAAGPLRNEVSATA